MPSGDSSSQWGELDEIDLEDRDPRMRGKGKDKPVRAGKSGGGGGGGGGGRFGRFDRARVLEILKKVAIYGGAGLGAFVLVVIGLFIYYGSDPKLPKLDSIGDYRPRQVTRVVDRDGKPIGEIGAERRTIVPFSKIPKVFLDAVVAAEDPNFYQHKGLDYRGIARAVMENVLAGRYAQGGSTITQQVVKSMLLSPEKTLRRKVQEWILARRISQKLTKAEILEIYVNQNNYGQSRYGCEEAARFYFGKSIAEVDLPQAAMLAGLPQSPTRLSPRRYPQAAKNRQMYVLRQMVEQGYIPRATAEALASQPIVVIPEPQSGTGTPAPEAVAVAYRRLQEGYGDRLATLGATVKTTIDLRMQEQARQALERGLEDIDARQGYRGPSGRLAGAALEKHRKALTAARKGKLDPSAIVEAIVERVDKDPADPRRGKLFVDVGGLKGAVDFGLERRYALGPKPFGDRFKPGDLVRVRLAPDRRKQADPKELLPLALELGPQAAMVVMDPQTREIFALVGGYNFRPGGFDRSQRAHRQPGSAFKPFIYATAIDSRRYTPASVVNDSPDAFDKWKPQNYERTFRGPVRLRTALAHSINTVAIKLLADLQLPLVRDMAQRAGITSEIPDSLFLSAALGTMSVYPLELANAYATFATGGQRGEPRLVTAVGEEVIPPQPLQPAMRPETAYVIVSMMRSVLDEGTGRSAGGRLRRPIAGKTGTTDENKDAWFVGFTPDLLAAVWVGFDDGKVLGKTEASTRTAVPIWTEFMAKALATRPVRDFAQPPGVVVTPIDPATGMLAQPGAEAIDEVFIDGTAPTELAPVKGTESSPDKLLLEGQ